MALGSSGGDALHHNGQVGLRVELMAVSPLHEGRQNRPALGTIGGVFESLAAESHCVVWSKWRPTVDADRHYSFAVPL